MEQWCSRRPTTAGTGTGNSQPQPGTETASQPSAEEVEAYKQELYWASKRRPNYTAPKVLKNKQHVQQLASFTRRLALDQEALHGRAVCAGSFHKQAMAAVEANNERRRQSQSSPPPPTTQMAASQAPASPGPPPPQPQGNDPQTVQINAATAMAGLAMGAAIVTATLRRTLHDAAADKPDPILYSHDIDVEVRLSPSTRTFLWLASLPRVNLTN